MIAEGSLMLFLTWEDLGSENVLVQTIFSSHENAVFLSSLFFHLCTLLINTAVMLSESNNGSDYGSTYPILKALFFSLLAFDLFTGKVSSKSWDQYWLLQAYRAPLCLGEKTDSSLLMYVGVSVWLPLGGENVEAKRHLNVNNIMVERLQGKSLRKIKIMKAVSSKKGLKLRPLFTPWGVVLKAVWSKGVQEKIINKPRPSLSF